MNAKADIKHSAEHLVTPTIITQVVNGTLPKQAQAILQQGHPNSLGGHIEHFFELTENSIGILGRVRQGTRLAASALGAVKSDAATLFQGGGLAFGFGQAGAEFVELVNMVRKREELTPKKASKMLANAISVASLVITTLSISPVPIIAAADALAGLVSGFRSYMRMRDDVKKLKDIRGVISDLDNKIWDIYLKGGDIKKLTENLSSLKMEEAKLSKIVKFGVVNASERALQFGNLLVLIGAIMTCVPPVMPIGIALVTIGKATKFLFGTSGLIARYGAKKEQHAHEIDNPYIKAENYKNSIPSHTSQEPESSKHVFHHDLPASYAFPETNSSISTEDPKTSSDFKDSAISTPAQISDSSHDHQISTTESQSFHVIQQKDLPSTYEVPERKLEALKAESRTSQEQKPPLPPPSTSLTALPTSTVEDQTKSIQPE